MKVESYVATNLILLAPADDAVSLADSEASCLVTLLITPQLCVLRTMTETQRYTKYT